MKTLHLRKMSVTWTTSFLLFLIVLPIFHCFAQHEPYQSLIVAQSIGNFGNIIQGRFINSSSPMLWKWRNFTEALGDDIAGISVSNDYESIIVAMMTRSGIVSSDGRSFSILAQGLSYCHYAVLFRSEHYMLYTDARDRIYKVNLTTNQQTILLDNVGGPAGTRGLAYDSINNWIYFSGVQLMRSRPDGTELQNITQHLNLSDANPGFQIILDSHTNSTNPQVYLAFDGGLYMANADGSTEQLIFQSPTGSNYTGPYGVAVGIDPFDYKRYIYWCRGRRSKEAYLERSVLSDDGRLTTIESIWFETSSIEAPWYYALALVPWKENDDFSIGYIPRSNSFLLIVFLLLLV